MIFGMGVNDISCKEDSYPVWHSMLRRCYSKVYQKTKPTYIGCQVSIEWLLHSNFNVWFNSNYVKGWQLDKDLLRQGNLVYSKETCCFLPPVLNSLIIVKKKENSLPQGVYFKANNNKYIAQLSYCEDGLRSSGHICINSDVDYCFRMYKAFKESKIKEMANKYRRLLRPDVYTALQNYEVKP